MPINQQNPPKTADRTIDKFKSRISGGIARPNLFEVVLATPDGVVDTDVNDFGIKSRFLVKAAALPASNIAPISVPFRGRTLKIAGDRTFDEWTVTVINDTDFAIRSSMERWMNSIAKVSDNSGLTNPEDYIKDLKIYQLGRAEVAQNTQASETDMPILRTYKFHGCFPTNVSQLDLSYDQADALEEFTVTFQVQWWEADGNGGSVY
jgi:hypothetical protein|tara:strand:- start:2873 stop:3493 length:621 start_codon:yes stop_codon:yes gene_type:complete